MEIKNINLTRKDFQSYFYQKHLSNWSLFSIPLLVIMVTMAFIARTISVGFDFVGACYLITILIAFLYLFMIFKLTKSYENKPFDLFLDKGIYEIRRKNENKKPTLTFRKDLKDFLYYVENDKYYYLFPEKNTTFVLPKSLFDEENGKYFVAQINKKVAKKKKPWVSRIFNLVLSISAVGFTIFFFIGMLK